MNLGTTGGSTGPPVSEGHRAEQPSWVTAVASGQVILSAFQLPGLHTMV